MKYQILALGVFLCLGGLATAQTSSSSPTQTQAQTQTQTQTQKGTQTANRVKRDTSSEVSINGCVDQRDGQYVLRDTKTDQLINLQSASGNADDNFARFVGHQVNASGSESSGTLSVAHIGQVADMCPLGK